MSKIEYVKAIETCEINEDRVKAIEKIYQTKLVPIVMKIVSYADQADFFDDERRALTYIEIFNPLRNMGFDFVKQGLIPFVDLYDNSYAVFNIATSGWGCFNTIDGMFYKECKSMEDTI